MHAMETKKSSSSWSLTPTGSQVFNTGITHDKSLLANFSESVKRGAAALANGLGVKPKKREFERFDTVQRNALVTPVEESPITDQFAEELSKNNFSHANDLLHRSVRNFKNIPFEISHRSM